MVISSTEYAGGFASGWIIAPLVLLLVSVALLLWRQSAHNRNWNSKSDHTRSKQATAVDDEELAVETQLLTILYGTQTGTAESFAKVLAGEVKARYRSAVSIQTMDLEEFGSTDEEYSEKFGRERLTCFLIATYGDGEPTDNAARFCSWLTSKTKEDPPAGLPHLRYAVFGLGNKQYEHFNKIGKSVDDQLQKLGAEPMVPLGLGDDDACLEDDFSLWREGLLTALDTLLTSGGGYEVAVPEYRVTLLEREEEEAVAPAPAPGLFWAALKSRRQLHTQYSDRSAIHCEVDLSGSGLSYCAGDHCAVYPQNELAVVEAAGRCLGLPLETVFQLQGEKSSSSSHSSSSSSSEMPPFPGPCSLRTALSCYSDLLSSPKKSALLALAAHAAKPEEAQRLRHLASPEGKAEYSGWVVDAHRSLVEVMEAFPSSHPPLGVFFASIAPRLQPRFYSVSSSPRLVGPTLHITCAVVEERTGGGRVHRGVASTWLKEVEVERVRVPVFLRSSTFRLPSDPLTPIIMVGPGTGIAPFRGFLQERLVIVGEGKEVGVAHLFFGCRSPDKDYIYKEELEAFVDSKALTHLHTAFSRVSDCKQYVQHVLMDCAPQVWDLLSERGAYIYVCGDAKAMAKDVHRTLHAIVQQEGSMSASASEVVVKKWQTEGRYLRDVW